MLPKRSPLSINATMFSGLSCFLASTWALLLVGNKAVPVKSNGDSIIVGDRTTRKCPQAHVVLLALP